MENNNNNKNRTDESIIFGIGDVNGQRKDPKKK